MTESSLRKGQDLISAIKNYRNINEIFVGIDGKELYKIDEKNAKERLQTFFSESRVIDNILKNEIALFAIKSIVNNIENRIEILQKEFEEL